MSINNKLNVYNELYSPSLTGAAQLSGEDGKETVGLLSRFGRDPRLLEALEKLRDNYLLDDTAWPVIMQWFYEDENK